MYVPGAGKSHVILPTQEADIRRTAVRGQRGQCFLKAYLENTQHKKGQRVWSGRVPAQEA
jgi:hypothetical protein